MLFGNGLLFDNLVGGARLVLLQLLLGFLGLRQSEWSIEVREDHASHKDDQSEYNDDDSQNLIRVSWVSPVASKLGNAGAGLGLSQVDKEDNEDVWDEMLHQQTPDKWDLADDLLHLIAQLHNVSKVNLIEERLHGPLSVGRGDNSLGKVSSDCDSNNVPRKECDKASPYSSIGRSSVPYDAAEDDGTKVSGHEGIDDGSSLGFDLPDNIVGPGTSKCLEETDQNHHEIDVKVNDVQEVETSIGAVHDGEEETNEGDTGCEPEAGEVLKEGYTKSKEASKCEYMTEKNRRAHSAIKHKGVRTCIVHDGDEGFQKGKCGVKSEQEQIEKDQSDPMDATR